MKKAFILLAAVLLSTSAFAQFRIESMAGLMTESFKNDFYIGENEKVKLDFKIVDGLELTGIISYWNESTDYGFGYRETGIDSAQIAVGVQYTLLLKRNWFLRPAVYAGIELVDLTYKVHTGIDYSWGITAAVGNKIAKDLELFFEAGWMHLVLLGYEPLTFNLGISADF